MKPGRCFVRARVAVDDCERGAVPVRAAVVAEQPRVVASAPADDLRPDRARRLRYDHRAPRGAVPVSHAVAHLGRRRPHVVAGAGCNRRDRPRRNQPRVGVCPGRAVPVIEATGPGPEPDVVRGRAGDRGPRAPGRVNVVHGPRTAVPTEADAILAHRPAVARSADEDVVEAEARRGAHEGPRCAVPTKDHAAVADRKDLVCGGSVHGAQVEVGGRALEHRPRRAIEVRYESAWAHGPHVVWRGAPDIVQRRAEGRRVDPAPTVEGARIGGGVLPVEVHRAGVAGPGVGGAGVALAPVARAGGIGPSVRSARVDSAGVMGARVDHAGVVGARVDHAGVMSAGVDGRGVDPARVFRSGVVIVRRAAAARDGEQQREASETRHGATMSGSPGPRTGPRVDDHAALPSLVNGAEADGVRKLFEHLLERLRHPGRPHEKHRQSRASPFGPKPRPPNPTLRPAGKSGCPDSGTVGARERARFTGLGAPPRRGDGLRLACRARRARAAASRHGRADEPAITCRPRRFSAPARRRCSNHFRDEVRQQWDEVLSTFPHPHYRAHRVDDDARRRRGGAALLPRHARRLPGPAPRDYRAAAQRGRGDAWSSGSTGRTSGARTIPPTGGKHRTRMTAYFIFDESEKLVIERVYFDQLTVLKQLLSGLDKRRPADLREAGKGVVD